MKEAQSGSLVRFPFGGPKVITGLGWVSQSKTRKISFVTFRLHLHYSKSPPVQKVFGFTPKMYSDSLAVYTVKSVWISSILVLT